MADNKRLETDLTIKITDAMMLMSAMQIASNTALMCQNPMAMERLNQYRDALESLIPEEARHFEGRDWAEIGMALEHAQAFHVNLEKDRWAKSWERSGRIAITIVPRDDAPSLPKTQWRSEKSSFRLGDEAFSAVYRLLSDLAPLGCDSSLEEENVVDFRP